MAERKTTKKTQQKPETKKTRERSANRPYEAVIAEIDKKIADHQRHIETLTAKKKDILDRAQKKEAKAKEQKAQDVLASALESGLTPEQIMERLNIKP